MASERNRPSRTGAGGGSRAMSMREAVEQASRQFTELLGRNSQSVTGARKGEEGGWSVLIDVVELERIPSSTSVVATYRVDIDERGELLGYERLRRFTLGATDPI